LNRLTWVAVGAALCALSVAAGAFGAHALKARLSADSLALWETAAKYAMYGGLGLAMTGLIGSQLPRTGFEIAALAITVGTVIFSASLMSLALGAPRWFGAITPLGGALMILGFVLVAWTVLKN